MHSMVPSICEREVQHRRWEGSDLQFMVLTHIHQQRIQSFLLQPILQLWSADRPWMQTIHGVILR